MGISSLQTETSTGGPGDPPDDELAARSKADPQAFALLYRRYATRVYRFVRGRVADPAEAEDIVAQSFFDALAALPRYRPRGLFAAWLFAIVRRRCADHYRRRSRDQASEGLFTDPATSEMETEPLADLDAALQTLSGSERELLALRYAADLSYREIGRLLGRSEAAVKMATMRLLHRLRNRWKVRDV